MSCCFGKMKSKKQEKPSKKSNRIRVIHFKQSERKSRLKNEWIEWSKEDPCLNGSSSKSKIQEKPSTSKRINEETHSTCAYLNHRDQPLRNSVVGCRGLKNIGNTCFMNSALQCLNSIPGLVDWVLEQDQPTSSRHILDVYILLVQSMWSGQDTSIEPRDLKDRLSDSAPIFSNYGQKDAHEFMNSLLNAIERVNSPSFPIDLFRIHTQSTVKSSQCQHRVKTNGTMTFLPLPVPQMKPSGNEQIFLKDLITDFCQEEQMNGDYYCPDCSTYQMATEKTTVTEPLPRVLIIQLKRFPFDGTDKKIDTFVHYKPNHRNLLSNNDRYKLSAVLIHRGKLSGGHYTALAQHCRNQKWYRYDDSSVEEIDWQNSPGVLITAQAYVLIYLKENFLDHSDEEML